MFDAFWWTDGPVSNQRVLKDLVKNWHFEYPNDEIHLVVAPKARASVQLEVGPSIRTHEFRVPQHGLAVLLELPAVAAKVNPDVVLAQNFAPLFGVKASVFVHDLMFMVHPQWFTAAERLYFWLMQKSLNRARSIVTSSVTEATRIRNVLATKVTPTAIGLAIGSGLAEATPRKPDLAINSYEFVLIVGRLNIRKNLEYGIRALVQSEPNPVRSKIVVVGEPQGKRFEPAAELEELIRYGRLIFAGPVADAELAWLYSNCSAVTFPSLDEGFGLPIVEAQHYGAPLIVSDIPVFREVAGDYAQFMPIDDEPAATAAIDSARYRERPADASPHRERLLRSYSWRRAVTKLRESIAQS